ncbi:tRNA (guanine-N(7)-)-methyltransferase non-catalytic subunit trm82 [Microsporum audouinii]
MALRHQIQRIERLQRAQRSLFVAAAGPKLYTFDAQDGTQLDVWPSPTAAQPPFPAESQPEAEDKPTNDRAGTPPPGKRRKLSPASGEAKIDGKSHSAPKSKTSLVWTTISLLLSTPSGEHVIAVTGEDKCLRVFEVGIDGTLRQLSERCMPKKPCALALTQGNTVILCGDKFGDVYSLPLLPGDDYGPPDTMVTAPATEPKAFKPSANPLTVHTKKNLYSLQQQLRSPVVKREKVGPTFELKLLLGHVSMLTDLAFVSFPDDSRSYILSADRDEHIRVSRGLPQAHIIHGYCLGHTSFVSKLCIPPWAPELLISGGGDDYILVWNWREGRVAQKVLLELEHRSQGDIAVGGLLAVSFEGQPSLYQLVKGAILVSVERSQELLPFGVKADNSLVPLSTIKAAGNVLDTTSLNDQGAIIISSDNVHEPGSTTLQRCNKPSPPIALQQFTATVDSGSVKWEECPGAALDAINSSSSFDMSIAEDEKERQKQLKQLGESLYFIGNFRKNVRGDEE